jgi:hypothetical protein
VNIDSAFFLVALLTIDLRIVILRTIQEHNIDSTNHGIYPGINFLHCRNPYYWANPDTAGKHSYKGKVMDILTFIFQMIWNLTQSIFMEPFQWQWFLLNVGHYISNAFHCAPRTCKKEHSAVIRFAVTQLQQAVVDRQHLLHLRETCSVVTASRRFISRREIDRVHAHTSIISEQRLLCNRSLSFRTL